MTGACQWTVGIRGGRLQPYALLAANLETATERDPVLSSGKSWSWRREMQADGAAVDCSKRVVDLLQE